MTDLADGGESAATPPSPLDDARAWAEELVSSPAFGSGVIRLEAPTDSGEPFVVEVLPGSERVRPENLAAMLRRFLTGVIASARMTAPPPPTATETHAYAAELEARLEALDVATTKALELQTVRIRALEGRLAELPHIRARLDALEDEVRRRPE